MILTLRLVSFGGHATGTGRGMSERARVRAGRWLRTLADRIDPRGAPRLIGWSFTIEEGHGIRFRRDGRGCRLAYPGNAEYERAHTEADSA